MYRCVCVCVCVCIIMTIVHIIMCVGAYIILCVVTGLQATLRRKVNPQWTVSACSIPPAFYRNTQR